MKVLLFRHGLAADAAPQGDDAQRPLTEKGVRRTRSAAEGLASIISRPDLLATSPLLRAKQTAQLLAKPLHREPVVWPELASGPPGRIIQKLTTLDVDSLILVGHEPTFSRLVQQVCTGVTSGSWVQMKKAGCACLDFDPLTARGALLWLVTPRILARLGK